MYTKQAVILIHGIGEQRPMSTLRGFVESLTGTCYQSKPDALSESFELRRLDYLYKTKETEAHTHFYEYYWAARMRETRFAHVFDWLVRLLFPNSASRRADLRRTPLQNPRLIRLFCKAWRLIWAGIVVGILVVGAKAAGLLPGYDLTAVVPFGWIVIVAIVVARLALRLAFAQASAFILGSVGDAARYLNAAPANVAERQAIRADGIALLKKLHSENYDRIVIVGHSLGSVIGYDMLKHYWIEVNARLSIENLPIEVIRGVECPVVSALRFQRCQNDLWEHMRANHRNSGSSEQQFDCPPDISTTSVHPAPAKWLVSDFVTLGSPLAYGAFLLAESSEEFCRRTEQRELPVCPPVRNGAREDMPGRYVWPDKSKERLYLHHAALFAVTRWSNLYFPTDPLAGPLACVFGSGIVDIQRTSCARWPKSRSHMWYWRSEGNGDSFISDLRNILKLPPTPPDETMHPTGGECASGGADNAKFPLG